MASRVSVVMNEKYRDSEIHIVLKSLVPVHIGSDMGSVDFWPTSGMGCVFLSEAEVVNLTGALRSKLANLAKVCSRGVVIAESTAMSEQYVDCLQQLATIELNLVTLTAPTRSAAAGLLARLAKQEPCKIHRKQIDGALLEAVQTLPKVGSVKAKALLEKFTSLRGISLASVEELGTVIGQSSAAHVYAYFHQPVSK